MKCPSCEQNFGAPVMQGFESGVFLGHMKWKCIAFCCPSCHAVLSAQVDPIAIKTDIVNELMQALRKP